MADYLKIKKSHLEKCLLKILLLEKIFLLKLKFIDFVVLLEIYLI